MGTIINLSAKKFDYFPLLLLNRILHSIDYGERWPNEEFTVKGWI